MKLPQAVREPKLFEGGRGHNAQTANENFVKNGYNL